MPRIAVLALSSICAAALAACGVVGSAATKATTTVPRPKVTASTVPPATVDVQPVSGPIGTSFQLAATGFQNGEMVTFQITFPDTKTFKGPAHKATATGGVMATFRVTTGNPLGHYQVTGTGDKGTQATGAFDVTSGTGAAVTTTVVTHSTTTLPAHSTTTLAAHSTTTVIGRTSTTIKP